MAKAISEQTRARIEAAYRAARKHLPDGYVVTIDEDPEHTGGAAGEAGGDAGPSGEPPEGGTGDDGDGAGDEGGE